MSASVHHNATTDSPTLREDPQELFNEIRHVNTLQLPAGERYHRLNLILTRAVKDCTATFKAEFTHLNTRLHTLCKTKGIPVIPLVVFRANARKAITGIFIPSDEDYRYDLKALCEGISAFYHYPIPGSLNALLPSHWRKLTDVTGTPAVKRMRLTVDHWDNRHLYGWSSEDLEHDLYKVCYAPSGDAPFTGLDKQLYEGAQVNLLNTRVNTENGETVLYPDMVILNPDFLIDITALCACMKPYGNSAYAHLLNKMSPRARSAAIQLGNVANLFLDECVNESPADHDRPEEELYLRAIRKSFCETPLEYATLEGIDRDFFNQCAAQFHAIRETVRGKFSAADIDINTSDVRLEPSFLCEAMGIQGRMDLLINDLSKLVELKSGKAEEFPHLHPRNEHQIQMALYKEMLYYNMDMPHNKVQSYLFYSRYPKFYAIDVPRADIRAVMALRNAIVHLEKRLCDGHSRDVFAELDEAHLNTSLRNDRFYFTYLRPEIIKALAPLQRMTELESAYFHTFFTFMEREQFLAKTGDDRPDSSRGFADTWNADTATKQQNGNILTDLSLTPQTEADGTVVGLRADLPDYGEDFLPNFRQGDMVMLYARQDEKDNVTNSRIYRCVIEEIHPDHYLLRLMFKQRHADAFSPTLHYAIEPSYSDGTAQQAYAGLFSLLTAPSERKALILGQRRPETDTTVSLNGQYGSEETNRIVLQAKQAKDYFLLVGPPGTGKTSVALKSMVEEFLSDVPRKTLLLMAYTNRAVDEICAMLATISPSPDYIRIGQELNCDPAYRSRLLSEVIAGAANRSEIYSRLAPVQLFVGTISSLFGHTELFSLKPIDIAIIDEASQVLEPQLLPLLCATTTAHSGDYNLRRSAIGKFILIGDHKQLPAVVVQRPESSRVDDPLLHAIGLTDCRNSFFERLHALQRLWNTRGIVAMLHKQGRMHPALSAFVNTRFYEGKLDIVPVRHQTEELEFHRHDTGRWQQYVATTRMGFIPVEPDEFIENNKCNRYEAKTVVRLVDTIAALCRQNGLDYDFRHRIGIIVPFRGQIAMIRRALSALHIPDTDDITIDTVERYQGSQRDIILFSTTVSRHYQLSVLSEPVLTDGQWIDRKLNVAITRARKQFFLIGNGRLLSQCPAYRELIDFFNQSDILHDDTTVIP